MSSGLDGAAIIDYDGSIPGARQGLAANRPAAGTVIGDWYLATDAQILYGWTGTAWVVLLDGSGGGGGTWQSVMTAGNTTNTTGAFVDGLARTLIQFLSLAGGGDILVSSPAAVVGISGAGAGLISEYDSTDGVWNNGILGWDIADSGVNISYLLFKPNTQRRWAFMPDKSGTVAVGGSNHFSSPAFTGGIINIPHGIVDIHGGPLTPTYAGITASNAVTAAVLAPGFYCLYTATLIEVVLVTGVALATDIEIDWNAIT